MGIQLKTKLHRLEALSASGLPHRRLCHRPAVFFLHLHITVLSFFFFY
jgi:hypothetical protein